MAPVTLRSLLSPYFRRHSDPEAVPQIATDAAVPAVPLTVWPASRLALTSRLWGDGYIFPGGELETLRLARPLGLSPATSLLLVGAGAGAPAVCIARNLGPWVTAVETDPSLLAAARGFVNRSDQHRKISIEAWDPNHPAFTPGGFHHCIALQPLCGYLPEPILHVMVDALKPGGAMVLTELAVPEPLDPNDPTIRRWAELEHRDPATIPSTVGVGRMLGRFGMDVRVAEDISARHVDQALAGWRFFVAEMSARRPSLREATILVAEAELWLLRRRLIRQGRLRMMRWQAFTRAKNRTGQAGRPATKGLSTA